MSHPGGALGKKLLVKNRDLMVEGNDIPRVNVNDSLFNAIVEMNTKKLGFVGVFDTNKKIVGIFTDGDLRRLINKDIDLKNETIEHFITKDCITVKADMLAVDSLKIMQEKSITGVIVINEKMKYVEL